MWKSSSDHSTLRKWFGGVAVLALAFDFLTHPARAAGYTWQSAANPGASAAELFSATGTVMKLNCARNLEIELKTSTGVLHFHDQPGVHVNFIGTNSPEGFDPCKLLSGRRVTVQYKPDDKKGKSNTIYTLRVYAPGEAEVPDAPRQPAVKTLKADLQEREHPTVTTEGEGLVKSVSCSGQEMNLVLLDHDVELKLRARDYARISIEEDVPFQTGNFEPCHQLAGHEAKITFVIAEGKGYDGEIQSIEVLK
jgi:hypothetical protein